MRPRSAAAAIAATAEAAGIVVTEAGPGRFRIIGNAGKIAAAIGRSSKDLHRGKDSDSGSSRDVEIIIGPIEQSGTETFGGRDHGRTASAKTAKARTAGRARPPESAPKARALLLGAAIAEADLEAAGGTLGLDEVMQLLRISRQAIDKKVKDDALLAVSGRSNRRRYPVCQFRSDGVVPGLRGVLRALPSRDPWFRLNFLVNPDPRLNGKQPCELLQQGEAAVVMQAARRVGDMGA
jgi:hypothetical protein